MTRVIVSACAVCLVTVVSAARVNAQSSFNWSFGYVANQPTAAATWSFGTGATASPVKTGNDGLGTGTFGTVNPSSGYAGASGTNWMGKSAAAGTALNANTSSYFSVTLTPQAGRVLDLNEFGFAARTAATGAPTLYALRSSVDNFQTSIASGTIAQQNWAFQTQFGTLARLGASAGAPVELRLYTFGGTSNTNPSVPNIVIDDLHISYTPITAPVPEPATGLAAAVAGLAAWRVRRRLVG